MRAALSWAAIRERDRSLIGTGIGADTEHMYISVGNIFARQYTIICFLPAIEFKPITAYRVHLPVPIVSYST
ncbi:MAG: hypothetical protein PHG66_03545 [Candidatus Colwellbacteria bacterium]|nr:hypothetical protein [Candidatus Colwellbacteria bacterium]